MAENTEVNLIEIEKPEEVKDEPVVEAVQPSTSVEIPPQSNNFPILTTDQVLESSSDPCWSNTRKLLLICFWLGWFSLMAFVIVHISKK